MERDVGHLSPYGDISRLTSYGDNTISRIERRMAAAEEAAGQIAVDDPRLPHARGYIRGLTEALAILRGTT